jgi:hypothetical protein
MARHSVNDWFENLSSLEGADKNRFLKAHAEYWNFDMDDPNTKGEYSAMRKTEDGEEFANYILSFTSDGKQALMDWLNEASEKGLIDSPYDQPEEEEEDERPVRRQTKKAITKRTSSKESESTGKRGRKPLTEDEIEEMRESLARTGSISETSEETGRARATIMNYIPKEERAELGVRVWGSGKVHQEEEEDRPRRRTSREVSTGRSRSNKEATIRRSVKESVKSRTKPQRTSRGR